MSQCSDDLLISSDRRLLQMDRVEALLRGTPWGMAMPRRVMEKAAAHSLCFGVYHRGRQVGYARAVTDHATMYYLCDVVIDPAYRGRGLGRALVEFVARQPGFDRYQGMLDTEDAHGLYRQVGFAADGGHLMVRHRETPLDAEPTGKDDEA